MSGRVVALGGGLALLAGSTVQAAAHRDTFSDTVNTWYYQLGAWSTLVGCVLLVVWLIGEARSRSIGPVLAAAGSCLMGALAFSEATVNPALADAAPQLLNNAPPATMLAGMTVAAVAFAGGWLSLGVSMVRRGAPRAAASALIVAALASAVPILPGSGLVGLAVVWWATTSGEHLQPADAR